MTCLNRIRPWLLLLLVIFAPTGLLAACPTGSDIGGKSGVRLTRDTPYFQSVHSVNSKGEVLEQRDQVRADGTRQKVLSTYQDGLWTTKREGPQGTLELRYGKGLQSFDVEKIGDRVSVSITLLSNGRVSTRGRIEAEVMRKDRLRIGRCTYSVFVVHSKLSFSDGIQIYREAFYQPDLRLTVASVSMNPDWTPRPGVFFDKIETVRFK